MIIIATFLAGNPCPDPEKPFPCKESRTCIPMAYVCDDNYDCEGGYDEDESLCTAGNTLSLSPSISLLLLHPQSISSPSPYTPFISLHPPLSPPLLNYLLISFPSSPAFPNIFLSVYFPASYDRVNYNKVQCMFISV